MSYTRAKLRHKLRGNTLEGYRCERTIRGRTIDMFAYRTGSGRWHVLHYPSGFILGYPASEVTRGAAVQAVADYLAANVSDYLLDQADRRPDPERYFGWPYETA